MSPQWQGRLLHAHATSLSRLVAQGRGKRPLRVLEDPLGIAGTNVMTFEYIGSGSPFKVSIPRTKTLAEDCVGMDGEPPLPKTYP